MFSTRKGRYSLVHSENKWEIAEFSLVYKKPIYPVAQGASINALLDAYFTAMQAVCPVVPQTTIEPHRKKAQEVSLVAARLRTSNYWKLRDKDPEVPSMHSAMFFRLYQPSAWTIQQVNEAGDFARARIEMMVKTQSNEWRQTDLTGKEFVQFELDTEGGNQDDITDRRATIFHHDKEVAIVFAVTPNNPDECEAKLSKLQREKIGVHFGLNNAWQLKQLRIGEDDEVKRISVEGLLYLRAERKDNKLYLVHRTRHFWPNFSTAYYRKAMQQSPDGRFPFRSAKSMKLFLDTSCEFAGTQIFEVQHTDDSEELDQELIDPSEWDQKLEYTLKSTKLLLLDRPYRFRCDPSNFTNKTSALMMLGGGFASTAALMQEQAKWLNGVTGDGNWQAEWAENIKDLFVNTLSYGFGEDSEGQEKTSNSNSCKNLRKIISSLKSATSSISFTEK